jgi:hypothetical protein
MTDTYDYPSHLPPSEQVYTEYVRMMDFPDAKEPGIRPDVAEALWSQAETDYPSLRGLRVQNDGRVTEIPSFPNDEYTASQLYGPINAPFLDFSHEVEAQNGYPDNNPKTAIGVSKLPLDMVPPSALHALATSFADGARKYGSYNWRDHAISSSVYYAAALRHLTAWWDGEETATDSGVCHIASAMACLAMLTDARSIGKLNDNRPPSGAASRMQAAWNKKNEDGPK